MEISALAAFGFFVERRVVADREAGSEGGFASMPQNHAPGALFKWPGTGEPGRPVRSLEGQRDVTPKFSTGG